MQIAKELPQFNNNKALILVTGNKSGEFFIAGSGEIIKQENYEEQTPHYSDREGFFSQSGPAGMMVSGSVYESKEDEVESRFINYLKKEFNSLFKYHPDINQIYIFSPGYFKQRVVTAIPKAQRPKIKEVYAKDMIKKHPFELLKIIGEKSLVGKSVPRNENAGKILAKAKIAEQKLGKKETDR